MTVRVTMGRDLVHDNGSGSTNVGLELSYKIPVDSPIEDIVGTAKKQLAAIKGLVYTELGLVFNETNAGIVEIFPGAVPVADWGEPVPVEPTQLSIVTDTGLTSAATEQQQRVANHLGNVVVPPTGDAPMGSEIHPLPLPDPSTLATWQDQCWFSLLAAPHEWIDARNDDDVGADFVAVDSARFPMKGQLGAPEPQELWLSSKYGPAPQWVRDNLHLIGGVSE